MQERLNGRAHSILLSLFLATLLIEGRSFAQSPLDLGEEAEGQPVGVGSEMKVKLRTAAVANRNFVKAGRLEVFPHVYANVLSNSYANRFLILSGISVAYHFTEAFQLEAVADLFPTFPDPFLKSLTITIADRLTRPGEELPIDIPSESAILAVNAGVTPIYGKINLVGWRVQGFDVSFVGGGGLLTLYRDTYQKMILDTGEVYLSGPLEPRLKMTFPMANVGMSFRLFVTRSLTGKVDLRYYGYLEPVEETVDNGVVTTRAFRNAVVISTGLSLYLP